MEQIAGSLRGEGLDLSTPTLKSYLARAKAAQAKRKRAGAKSKGAGGADAPAATVVAQTVTADAARGAAPKKAGKDASPVMTAKAEPGPGSEPVLRSGKDAFLIKDKDSY